MQFFTDRASIFDPKTRTVVSVRDGVMEYYGGEIGITPANQIFTVYRSPATIANAAVSMPGIPVCDGHVDVNIDPPTDGGLVESAGMIDQHDESTGATIAIQNTLTISDTLTESVDAGKIELSLGYHAELIPSEGGFDFEQQNIRPHHLAIVDAGRCGSACRFIDERKQHMKLHEAFTDAEGMLNLQQVAELAAALPEAIKAVPLDQLSEILPALQGLVEAAKGVLPEEEVTEPSPVENTEGIEDVEEDEPKEVETTDAAKVASIVDAAITRHASVMDKASGFVADNYTFADKSTEQIMRDALATECKDEFKDEELEVAFKLLKKSESEYKQFGDVEPNAFDKLKDQEI